MPTAIPAPEMLSLLLEVKFVPVATMPRVEPAGAVTLSNLVSVGVATGARMVNGTGADELVPMLTVTLRGPGVAALSIVKRAVIWVGLAILTPTVTPVPDTVTFETFVKWVPVSATTTVAPAVALAGVSVASVGGTAVTLNATGAVDAVPDVIDRFRAPGAASGSTTRLAVIWVALTKVTPLTPTPAPPTRTVEPVVKFVPVRVTLVVEPLTALDGLTDVRVGAGVIVNVTALVVASGVTLPGAQGEIGPIRLAMPALAVEVALETVTLRGPVAAVLAMAN